MIAKTYIESNLKRIENKFNRSRSNKESLFYSKMAILELCGWIEESMDDIVLRCGYRNLNQRCYKEFVKDDIVKPIYGFKYNEHFKSMLVNLIGLITYEKVEKAVDQIKLQKLKSTLGSLTTVRNAEAHTHIKTTRSINAPTVTKKQFIDIYDGLVEIDMKLRLIL